MGNGPIEPSSDARRTAHACHDMFVALLLEGFTENQALVIIGNILAIAASQPPEGQR